MTRRPRVVSITAVKNDMWILPTWFRRNPHCVDAMVVLDDGSTDGSREFLRSRPEISVLLENQPGQPWRLFDNTNRMIDAARELGADWLFAIDSDDLVDERFPSQRDSLLSVADVRRYHFREVSLWRSSQQFRSDRADLYGRPRGTPPFLVRMTPGLRFLPPHRESLFAFMKYVSRDPRILLDRFVPKTGALMDQGPGREVALDLVHLHYHFADRDVTWMKHITYALYGAMQQRKSLGEIPEIVASRDKVAGK